MYVWSRRHIARFCYGFFSLFLALILIKPYPVSAATQIANRSVTITSPIASAVTTHQFAFTMLNTTDPVGSISLEYCSNTPVIGDTCSVPTGLNALFVNLSAQTGNTGFSVHSNTTANRIVISRASAVPVAASSTYTFDNLTNPDTTGSHYVRIQTYASTDGTGIDIENGGVVFVISSGLQVSAEVPPYIRFCVGVTIATFECSSAVGSFIDFGELRTNATAKASSQFLVATNADFGYSVFISGTTMTSGTNIIPALAVPTSSTAGVSQFGVNLKANTSPAVGSEVVGPGVAVATASYGSPNQYKFVPGEAIVTVPSGDDTRKFTVSYITNIAENQVAGVYVTTLTYICLANF